MQLKCQHFQGFDAKPGDFVYFDPLYHVANDIGFTGYTTFGFSGSDNGELHDQITELHHAGVNIMPSNSNTPFIRELYKEPFPTVFMGIHTNINFLSSKI